LSKIINLFIRKNKFKEFLTRDRWFAFLCHNYCNFLSFKHFLCQTVGISTNEWSISMGHSIAFSPAWWMVRLDLGVKFFFSISGFILALPFLNQMFYEGKKVDIKDYLYRRLTRVRASFCG
jgi:hypothetical protein